MRQLTKKVYLKTRIYLIILISIVIGASYMFVYEEISELRSDYREAMQIWDGYNIRKAVGASVKAETQDTPWVEEEVLLPSPNEEIKEIVSKVYRLESSGGKNDSCRKIGKWNGYGYAQNTRSWNCYDSQDEVKGLVENWFEKNLEDKTTAEALCYYNEGKIKSDCGYYQKYLKL